MLLCIFLSIQNCKFQKKSISSYLKVTISSNLRIYNCNNCCKRWFVTFNGAECSPIPIDAVEYYYSPNRNSLSQHQARTIIGHCKITRTGIIDIGFNIGNCHTYGDSDGYTGWNSATRILIEEVNAPQSSRKLVS